MKLHTPIKVDTSVMQERKIFSSHWLRNPLLRYSILIPLFVFFTLSWQKSYTGDEGLTVYLASNSYSHLLTNVGADYHVPAYYTLLWTVAHVFGSSLLVMRLFSLTIVALLLIISLKHLPFPAALLLATSPYTLHLALEVRMYGLLALCGLLVVLAWRKYQQTGSTRALILLTLSLSFCTWVHYFGWVCLPAVLTILLLKGKWKPALFVFAAVVVLFLPWVDNVVDKFTPDSVETANRTADFPDEPSLVQRFAGIPFSTGGTLLRFSAGNEAFNFTVWGLRSISAVGAAGFLTAALLLFLAARGFKKTEGAIRSIFLWTVLGLALLRPTARHYAAAFPSFVVMVTCGLPGTSFRRKTTIAVLVVLLLVLCVPYTLRSTMPQRCTWDRDFLQIAQLSAEEAQSNSMPLVLFLDTYSLLGIKMHLQQNGFPDSSVWHPHIASFQQGICFYDDRWDCVEYLQHNTDSLVTYWLSLTDDNRGFVLVANDPQYGDYPIFGTGDNRFVGLGSDIMADMDLMEALARHVELTRIPIPGSRGPLSLFVCAGKNN